MGFCGFTLRKVEKTIHWIFGTTQRISLEKNFYQGQLPWNPTVIDQLGLAEVSIGQDVMSLISSTPQVL